MVVARPMYLKSAKDFSYRAPEMNLTQYSPPYYTKMYEKWRVMEIGINNFIALTCAAARSAFIELIGSAGSSADIGIPAACAAARIAALLALFD